MSRPEIQKFVGALQGHRAQKGVFITTSRYSSEAVEYAGQIQNKVVLIDGEQLAQLMIEHRRMEPAHHPFLLHLFLG